MSPSVPITPHVSIPGKELNFSFTRSGGPGGQNVNKVSTRVELEFNVRESPSLNDAQRLSIERTLGSRIGSDGILRIQAQESRSQWRNRQLAVEKFVALMQRALRPAKKRVASKPTTGSRAGRFKEKKQRGTVKKLRGRVNPEE